MLYAVSYGIGVPLVCVAFTVRVPRARMLGRLSELTLGVYLLHPVIVHVLYRFWSTEQSASWRAASAFSVACVLTAVLRSLPWVRRLV